jgi:hypothetical protein
MGTLEIASTVRQIVLSSDLHLYGNAISETFRKDIEEEIAEMWNEPKGQVDLAGENYTLVFRIRAFLDPEIELHHIRDNRNPIKNFFRLEEKAYGNISFVDGLGSNSGYFKIENLYKGSTTAAHEYGHTLGLDHPADMDIRGKGRPGIMYPRGTLVDPEFQYDPAIPAGQKGGTMHPIHRRVFQQDIDDLNIAGHSFKNLQSVIGGFTCRFHEAHVSNEGGWWT